MRNTAILYRIEVADFKGRSLKVREPRLNTSLASLSALNKMKFADVPQSTPIKVLFRRAKDSKAARRMGEKIGTVLACCKAKSEPYLKNIEYLTIDNKPISVEVRLEEFTLNKNLEVSRQKEQKYNVEIA